MKNLTDNKKEHQSIAIKEMHFLFRARTVHKRERRRETGKLSRDTDLVVVILVALTC